MQQPAPVAEIAATRVARRQATLQPTPPQRWRGMFALAAAGAATAAGAQEWRFQDSDPVVRPGAASINVVLSLDPGPADYAIHGVIFNAHASEPGWSDNVTLGIQPGLPYPWSSGEIVGASVIGITNGQLPPALGFTLFPGRVDIWRATFTVTEFTPREIDLSTGTSRLSVYREATGEATVDRTPIEGAATITVIPAPASAALLGASALGTLWRRRRRKETAR